MMTNAQAALLASATLAAGKHLSNQAVITIASEFKTALDLQDEEDRQASRVDMNGAPPRTPKPDHVIVMAQGQLYPTAVELIDAPKNSIFITYNQALAQGWTDERAL